MAQRLLTPSEQRRSEILAHSSEVLADMPHSYGTQSFILSESEAAQIGEAIHTRDHRAIYDLVNPVLSSAVEDYKATEPRECIGIWNQTFATIYGEGIKINDLLANDNTRELLNTVLTDSNTTQLGMDTTEYFKLLESVAIATMPDTGFRTLPASKRSRAGGSESALFYRTISLLDNVASTPPGIRTMREDVLKTDANALNKYMASMVRTHSAQETLATILDMEPHDIRRQKAGLELVFREEEIDHDIEIDDMLHILEWKMLMGPEEDRATRHKRIKMIIEGQSQTERQRRKVDYDWCPERLDFLIEIAEQAKKDGRNPAMYISNRFEEGAGVYVSVELDNPNDPTQKMLFADNPIAGNALYIVDEVRLENEGRPNSWQSVLGANRRIARERGAIRKYHTKNWQDILGKVMSMGETPDPEAAEKNLSVKPAIVSERANAATVSTPETRATIRTESVDELIERSRKAQERVAQLVAAAKTLTVHETIE